MNDFQKVVKQKFEFNHLLSPVGKGIIGLRRLRQNLLSHPVLGIILFSLPDHEQHTVSRRMTAERVSNLKLLKREKSLLFSLRQP